MTNIARVKWGTIVPTSYLVYFVSIFWPHGTVSCWETLTVGSTEQSSHFSAYQIWWGRAASFWGCWLRWSLKTTILHSLTAKMGCSKTRALPAGTKSGSCYALRLYILTLHVLNALNVKENGPMAATHDCFDASMRWLQNKYLVQIGNLPWCDWYQPVFLFLVFGRHSLAFGCWYISEDSRKEVMVWNVLLMTSNWLLVKLQYVNSSSCVGYS